MQSCAEQNIATVQQASLSVCLSVRLLLAGLVSKRLTYLTTSFTTLKHWQSNLLRTKQGSQSTPTMALSAFPTRFTVSTLLYKHWCQVSTPVYDSWCQWSLAPEDIGRFSPQLLWLPTFGVLFTNIWLTCWSSWCSQCFIYTLLNRTGRYMIGLQ